VQQHLQRVISTRIGQVYQKLILDRLAARSTVTADRCDSAAAPIAAAEATPPIVLLRLSCALSMRG